MAIIKLDGQDINIDDAIASVDEDLKSVLVPFYPQLANAEITRETNSDGLMVVRMIKRAGPKGNDAVIEFLMLSPNQLNPAIDLSWQAKQILFRNSPIELKHILDLQPQIKAAVKAGQEEKDSMARALTFLCQCPPQASNVTIAGF
ncbi:hypothetical protein [Nostoc sp. DedQUE07]|uniref:hypothetical protein n=1 Tax=Nostoc sp. DedQUE07 TaxID=3075392 RepID=UPI002AD1DBA4|nr:hypothetical protein [Nostoc sp. DedQUE07]MDZ8131871.1 hypothetical protein [Nostoc sp. DedQUE07]